jgi:hypothetical protein
VLGVKEQNRYISFNSDDIDYYIDKAYELYSDYDLYSHKDYLNYKNQIIKKDLHTIKYIKNMYIETLNKIYNNKLYY